MTTSSCSRTVILLLTLASAASAQTTQTPPTDPEPLRIGPVTLSGYLQADALKVNGDDLEEQNDTFRIRRMRVTLTGDLAPKVGWAFSLEAAGPNAHLRDAFVVLRFSPAATVRIGQFYQPFMLDRLTSTSRTEVIDRAFFTDRIALTRDPGVMLYNTRPFYGWLLYSLDVSNGSGMNVSDNNDAKDVTGRVVAAPKALGGLAIGANVSSGEQPEGTRTRSGIDVSIDKRRFKLVVEGVRERSDGTGPDRDGYYVLGVYRFHPKQVTRHFRMAEVAMRFTALDDPGAARVATSAQSLIPSTTRELQAGGNYYVNRNVRFMANIIVPADDRTAPSSTLISRMQIMF